jgi:hypothetical protein
MNKPDANEIINHETKKPVNFLSLHQQTVLSNNQLFYRSAVMRGGKSGQHRASCFLTGRRPAKLQGDRKCHRK